MRVDGAEEEESSPQELLEMRHPCSQEDLVGLAPEWVGRMMVSQMVLLHGSIKIPCSVQMVSRARQFHALLTVLFEREYD